MKPVWIVVAALCAGAGVIGYLLGQRAALDEGEVILHYAQKYAAETGGDIRDCHAAPGRRADVWIVVLCESAAGRFAYPVGRDGALIAVTGEEA